MERQERPSLEPPERGRHNSWAIGRVGSLFTRTGKNVAGAGLAWVGYTELCTSQGAIGLEFGYQCGVQGRVCTRCKWATA